MATDGIQDDAADFARRYHARLVEMRAEAAARTTEEKLAIAVEALKTIFRPSEERLRGDATYLRGVAVSALGKIDPDIA